MVIYDLFADLFDSHVYLPTHHFRQDEYIAPSAPSSKIRHVITSVKNCTAPGFDRIKPEHLKSLPLVIVKTLARLFTRYLSECKMPTSCKTSKAVLLYKKEDSDDIDKLTYILTITAQSACRLQSTSFSLASL
uniref:Reverse transcriptase domain-containing protein n=1 Tax=Haemonchus contortus TaxID=6289 RepID=A0A7I4YLT2_HAECO